MRMQSPYNFESGKTYALALLKQDRNNAYKLKEFTERGFDSLSSYDKGLLAGIQELITQSQYQESGPAKF